MCRRTALASAGKRSVTGDTALRFGHWFGVEPQFWLNLQAQFDLVAADQQAGAAIRRLPTRVAGMSDNYNLSIQMPFVYTSLV